jgi:mannan endo-1,4-beta-mannosidase
MLLAAAAVAVLSVVLVAVRFAPSAGHPAAHAVLPLRRTFVLGVYEAGAPPSYGPVAQFASVAGMQPGLIGYFSGWAEPFKTEWAQTVRGHGSVTLVQIDPTDASVAAIAAGTYDGYLRAYADSVRDFGHPVVIGFGHEMNAPWYSWGYGWVPAATFVRAWRHIVTLFRAQGADNVTWMWTLQADAKGTGPIASWWPGAQYVSWVGIDGYYFRPTDTFTSIFASTIHQVRELTSLPVLISETAVGPGVGQSARIQNLFHGMAAYNTLGLVWFDIAQHDGIYHQDWRIEDNPQAERSFRLGVREEMQPR